MAIYTDGVHVASNVSIDELHEFVTSKLNFKREWFQNHPRHPHYDIIAKRNKVKALKSGAILVSSKELMRIMWASKIWTPIPDKEDNNGK